MTAAAQPQNATQSMPALAAAARKQAGKGEVRRLRATGQIPAIAYGKGLPSTPIAVSPKEILTILKSEAGKNSVIKMQVEAKDILVMIRDYSYHPVKRNLEHVDFVEVKLDQPVDVDVPLIFHGKPAGLAQGGLIRQVYRTVPVRVLPDRIPLKLEIDITHLKLGEHVSTQDLKLAEGVAVRLPAEQTLISIVTPEKDRSAEEAAAAPGAAAAAPGAAPAAGAAAAGAKPAAGAKDAKAPAAAAPAKDAKKK
jgi:large subunit ribosomal protein L25